MGDLRCANRRNAQVARSLCRRKQGNRQRRHLREKRIGEQIMEGGDLGAPTNPAGTTAAHRWCRRLISRHRLGSDRARTPGRQRPIPRLFTPLPARHRAGARDGRAARRLAADRPAALAVSRARRGWSCTALPVPGPCVVDRHAAGIRRACCRSPDDSVAADGVPWSTRSAQPCCRLPSRRRSPVGCATQVFHRSPLPWPES